jgi:hypothetical protein
VNVNVNVLPLIPVIDTTPLKPAAFVIAAVIGTVKAGSAPATVAVPVPAPTVMLVMAKNGNCVGPLYKGSELLLVPAMSG